MLLIHTHICLCIQMDGRMDGWILVWINCTMKPCQERLETKHGGGSLIGKAMIATTSHKICFSKDQFAISTRSLKLTVFQMFFFIYKAL